MSGTGIEDALTVGLGIFVGLVWSRRTGWSCGGLVTPGLLALYAHDLQSVAVALLLGGLLSVPLAWLAQRWMLYGRERVGAAMLLALAARLGLSVLVPFDLRWVGWIVPGLVAADAERQGVVMTLCGAASCGIVTTFMVELLRGLGFGG